MEGAEGPEEGGISALAAALARARRKRGLQESGVDKTCEPPPKEGKKEETPEYFPVHEGWTELAGEFLQQASSCYAVPRDDLLYDWSYDDDGDDLSDFEKGNLQWRVVEENLGRIDRAPKSKRSAMQAEAHKFLLPSMAKLIFGWKCFAKNKRRILRERNWTEFMTRHACNYEGPRRMGKSYFGGQLVAGLMVSKPDFTCLVYAPSKDQACLIIDKVKFYLETCFPEHKIMRKRKNYLEIHGPTPGDKRWVQALAANSDTARGYGANLILIDEWAKIKDELFFDAILPLLQVRESCMVCLTTQDEKSESLEQRMNKAFDRHNVPLLRLKKVYMVCEECRKKKDVDAHEKCEHKKDLISPWIDPENLEWVEDVFKETNPERAKQELYMTAEPTRNNVFDEDRVDRVFTQPRYHEDGVPIRYVGVAIDPNSGKHDRTERDESDFAIVTGYFRDNIFVLAGVDSFPARGPSDYKPRVIQHLHKIREVPEFQGATIVLMIENMVGFFADEIIKHITDSGLERFVVMMEDELKTGIPAFSQDKENLARFTNMLLSEPLPRFFLERNIITTETGPQGLLDKMRRQFKDYSARKGKSNNPAVAPRTFYTGKITRRHKDDICVAAQMCCYYLGQFINSPRYKNQRGGWK